MTKLCRLKLGGPVIMPHLVYPADPLSHAFYRDVSGQTVK